MKRTFLIARLVVFALFLAAAGGEIGYTMLYVWPAQKCEKAGLWWDPKDRECLTPVPIERFTKGYFSRYQISPASPPAPTAHPPALRH